MTASSYGVRRRRDSNCRQLSHHRQPTLRGEDSALRTRALFISNNPVEPAPGIHPTRTRLDSGRLGVYGVREGPLRDLPRLALGLLVGTWPEQPRIFHRVSSTVAPRTKRPHRISVLNDGERRRLTTPLHYQGLPRVLRVLVPWAAADSGPNGTDSVWGVNLGLDDASEMLPSPTL